MIQIVDGDMFEGNADILIHQVNCQGVMGSGVARQMRERYPSVYTEYRAQCDRATDSSQLLGRAQAVWVDREQLRSRLIINLFSQNEFGYNGAKYTDYEAMERGLAWVGKFAKNHDMTIGLPYHMGCCRGGGDWNIVYKIIERTMGDRDVTIYRCDRG